MKQTSFYHTVTKVTFQAISRASPRGLQTFLASATLTDELKKIFCHSPVIPRVHDAEDQDISGGSLKQYVVRCAEDEKYLLLYVIFKLKGQVNSLCG